MITKRSPPPLPQNRLLHRGFTALKVELSFLSRGFADPISSCASRNKPYALYRVAFRDKNNYDLCVSLGTWVINQIKVLVVHLLLRTYNSLMPSAVGRRLTQPELFREEGVRLCPWSSNRPAFCSFVFPRVRVHSLSRDALLLLPVVTINITRNAGLQRQLDHADINSRGARQECAKVY